MFLSEVKLKLDCSLSLFLYYVRGKKLHFCWSFGEDSVILMECINS